MHGREGEDRRRRSGMWPVHGEGKADGVQTPSPREEPPVIGRASSEQSGPDFFLKDGRKIRVGDCALFQSGNAPPFIGIIRWFSLDKEDYLKVSVNWLYRPPDVKLAKGVLLEAAPNEVFYSFHKDEISAQSLLHPCKVAFLRKGVDLPPGISSFVCRRVYDIANKCLWWLTDQDYINEHQEEVDQLLDKTELEMHAAVQSGGRSPKQLNGPSSQQLKSGSDSVQNSGSSALSHGKGRKREKTEQNLDSIKRERAPKHEDGDSGNYRFDSTIRAAISKITDRGGLIDTEGVEKLLNLLQSEKKVDSPARVLLADVIASTDRVECLVKFVQLRGVLVLDDWLQEVHKSKIGDGSSPKESDKSVEELLLALLRALDKLPVDLHVLQTSSIGKSVNNLRQHKNSDIQKKARHLVDTWKKRVDAEIALKGPGTQTGICKNLAIKPGHVDAARSSAVSSGSSKLASPVNAGVQDAATKPTSTSGPSEMQLTAIKEEKSSGSSQSQTNSQSCSSDYAKNGGTSWREDARSSTAGSIAGGKGSSVMARHRKSSNGFLGTGSSVVHKEASLVKSSSVPSRSISYDKVPPSGTQCERLSDVLSVDTGSNQRLIVRLPNPGRSPARCTTSASHEESPVTGSRASSPVSSEKHEQNDHKTKIKGGSSRTNPSADVNADASSTNYKKVAASEDICLSGSLVEEPRSTEDNGNTDNAPKSSSSVKEKEHVSADQKSNCLHNPSLDLINALAESCVQYPQVSGLISAGDDIGMNLLASVATGEMPKSECLSPGSPERSSSAHDDCTPGPGAKLRSPDDISGVLVAEEANLVVIQTSIDIQGDGKKTGSLNLKSLAGNEERESTETEEKKNAGATYKDHNPPCPEVDKMGLEVDRTNQVSGKRKANGGVEENFTYTRQKIRSSSLDENKSVDSANGKTAETDMLSSELVCSSLVDTSDCVIGASTKMSGKKVAEETQSCTTRNINVDKSDKLKEEFSCSDPVGNHTSSAAGTTDSSLKGKTSTAVPNSFSDSTFNSFDQNKEIARRQSNGLAVCNVPLMDSSKDIERHGSCGVKTDDNGEVAASSEVVSLPKPEVSDGAAKCVFDLNEGITNDEGNAGESPAGAPLGCPLAIRMPSFLPFAVSSLSSASPVPITVAAPAKGPFVPPENLLKSKAEPGWKGSAATSAFRPAEPRKVLEMPLNASEASDLASVKQNRPPLEFDLNVPDDRVFHDIFSHSSAMDAVSRSGAVDNCDVQARNGGLDLDLNRVDEADCGPLSTSASRRAEVPNLSGKPASGGFSNADTFSSRGFDLNNGPGIDEVGAEPALRSQHPRNNASPFLPPMGGLRMNGTDLGNLWFPPGNSYSAVAIPPYLPDRGDHPYSIVAAPGAPRNLGSSTGGGSFSTDLYRGPVLSSSPAMAFSPYASFPFGPSFPLPSTSFSGVPTGYVDSSPGGGACFPPFPSQFTGPTSAASPAYVRPILINIPESSSSGAGSESRKWGRQSLDLNAGPIGADAKGRDERLAATARQHFVASSQQFTDDPVRLFQMAGAGLKRKEPEGGWDSDRFSCKQPSRP